MENNNESPVTSGSQTPMFPVGGGWGTIGESSQTADDGGVVKAWRSTWTDKENVALSKAYVSVCDDPLKSNNQRIINLWAKIAATYKRFHPDGKPHTGEECRKQWDRIRSAVSRFAGLYANNLRMKTSGQTMDDVRRMSEDVFPLAGVHREFTYWNCYEVLMESEKIRVGIEAGWPKKQRLNLAGDYSSSAGSLELPDSAEEVPSTPSFSRRTRPVGQKRAQRAASGLTGRSQEVQSTAPSRQTGTELASLARTQTQ